MLLTKKVYLSNAAWYFWIIYSSIYLFRSSSLVDYPNSC